MKRREFLLRTGSSATATAGLLLMSESAVHADDTAATSAKVAPWIRKSLKIGMVGEGKTLAEKFAIVKQAGFDSIELNAPGIKVRETLDAIEKSGLPVDGSVGANHWGVRHTDPDPKVRATALQQLHEGIRQTAAVGGDTLLLVPGHGKDGDAAKIEKMAIENIRPAIATAEKHGVTIVMENVWNQMFYEHNGPDDQTAQRHAAFVDAFDSPLVKMQFDIGNHWKYGDPAQWILTLDQRIAKLDAKGFSRKTGRFAKITEGDIDWASVCKSLRKIKFSGVAAAEVGGGNLQRLQEVNTHMNQAFELS
ncbi:MAG: sugar phosphate isomerase/epimerase family protein [Planctomycetota bacterium]